jgi:Spo0E like sporulation regulatory protein
MSKGLINLLFKIEIAKDQLEELYRTKGQTDSAVLKQSDKVDKLIIKYTKMVN